MPTRFDSDKRSWLIFLFLSAFVSFGQKQDYELISTEKVLVTPIVHSNVELTKIYIEPVDSTDTVYKSHLQGLFLKDKYQFVAKEEADWILRYSMEYERIFSMRGTRNKGQRSTEISRGVPATQISFFSGTELLRTKLKIYNNKNLLLDSVILSEKVDLTGESTHNVNSAETRYNEKVSETIPKRTKIQFSTAFNILAENYFTVERQFPIFVVSFKNHKKRFSPWNIAAIKLKEWFYEKPIDSKSSSLSGIKGTFEMYMNDSFDKTMNPAVYRTTAYYQLAVIEYFSGNYAQSHELMKKAIKIYPLMDNRQQQLWYTLEVYHQHGMF